MYYTQFILLRKSILMFVVVLFVCLLNATFSNISAISWQTVLVVEEAGVP
jgi:hypothetical protein